jgi:hypothetical protein
VGGSISIPTSLRNIAGNSFYVRNSLTLEVDDGVDQGERVTRQLVANQMEQMGNVRMIWHAEFLIRGGHDSIGRVNFEWMPVKEENESRNQSSSSCFLL